MWLDENVISFAKPEWIFAVQGFLCSLGRKQSKLELKLPSTLISFKKKKQKNCSHNSGNFYLRLDFHLFYQTLAKIYISRLFIQIHLTVCISLNRSRSAQKLKETAEIEICSMTHFLQRTGVRMYKHKTTSKYFNILATMTSGNVILCQFIILTRYSFQ